LRIYTFIPAVTEAVIFPFNVIVTIPFKAKPPPKGLLAIVLVFVKEPEGPVVEYIAVADIKSIPAGKQSPKRLQQHFHFPNFFISILYENHLSNYRLI
jgi:hypothetical protein